MANNGAIIFRGYQVKKIEFNINEEYDDSEVSIEFSTSSKALVDKNGQHMEIELCVDVFPQKEEMNYPFEMSVVMVGYFKINSEEAVYGNDVKTFEKNANAILFPYIRAIITTCTAAANVTPLVLPTININRMLSEREGSEQDCNQEV